MAAVTVYVPLKGYKLKNLFMYSWRLARKQDGWINIYLNKNKMRYTYI